MAKAASARRVAMTVSPLRLQALRLAVLNHADREWLLAQLPSSQSGQIRDLLGEIRASGLARYTTVLRQVLDSLAESPATIDPQEMDSQLHALRKPEWQTLFVHTLDAIERPIWETRLRVSNPFVYRRLFTDLSKHNLPPAWSEALKQYVPGEPRS